MLPGYRGPNTVKHDYTETGQIEKDFKTPDSVGHFFCNGFQYFNHLIETCMIFSCVLKKPHVRTSPVHLGKEITFIFLFSDTCNLVRVSPGSGSLSVYMDQSPAMSYEI